MSARSKARKRALDTIFEADLKGISIPATNTNDETDQEVANYSLDLVKGIKENQTQIDEMISNSLKDWSFDRIPRVDRNILRIAVYELLFQQDVPTNVVISEAVNLAESLSTAESSAFINGALGTISKKI
jgi:transcription antitermination protein NusB